MKRNTPLAILHVITVTSHLQRRKALLITLRSIRRYLVMIRGWKKSYVHTSVLIASDIMPTDGICWNINTLPIPRNKATGSCSDHTSRRSVCSPNCGVRFNHVKLLFCGCIIVGVRGSLRWFYVVHVWLNVSLSCIFIIVFILCPMLYRVGPAYNLAILSSAH